MQIFKTEQLTREQFEARIARFSRMQPTKRSFEAQHGIPAEAYEMTAAKYLYPLMAPEGNKRSAARPAISGIPGLEVNIVRCPPGQGAKPHAHMRSVESFLVLTGRYRIECGDNDELAADLEPFDMVSVPPGVMRRFTNVGEADALMLVLVQGSLEDAFGDIISDARNAEAISRRFGAEVLAKFANIGVTFGVPASRAGAQS